MNSNIDFKNTQFSFVSKSFFHKCKNQ